MKTKPTIQNVIISEMEYARFNKLSSAEKLNYLFNLVQELDAFSRPGPDLSEFFEDVVNDLSDNIDGPSNLPNSPETLEYTTPDYSDLIDSRNRVDVMIDETSIMVESNSLSAIRHVILKFTESGYILLRDTRAESMFREDKQTRYLRIYTIVDQTTNYLSLS